MPSRSLITLTVVGVSAISLAVFAAYDRFVSATGGIFCSTVTDASFKSINFKNERVCVGSGVDLKSRSFEHMGDESMYLIKNMKTVPSTCKWVDDSTFRAVLDVNGNKIDVNKASGCRIYSTVYIEKR